MSDSAFLTTPVSKFVNSTTKKSGTAESQLQNDHMIPRKDKNVYQQVERMSCGFLSFDHHDRSDSLFRLVATFPTIPRECSELIEFPAGACWDSWLGPRIKVYGTP